MRFWLFAGLAAAPACSEYALDDDGEASGDTGEQVEEPLPPVADAGPDRVVQPLDELTLDATASTDPGGERIVAVRWTLVSAPDGSRSPIVDADRANALFFADLAGTYVFELTVRNEAGLWDATPDPLVVTAVPLDGFYVELSWSENNDLDLHLLSGTGPLFGPADCSFCNMAPSWGGPGTDDDPSLDWDAIFGFGPETVTIDEPGDGVFDIRVHYYGEGGLDRCKGPCAESLATVNVYLGGVLEASFERMLSAQGDLWQVATIAWPERAITGIDLLEHTNRTRCR